MNMSIALVASRSPEYWIVIMGNIDAVIRKIAVSASNNHATDPFCTLRYTMTQRNMAATPATSEIPANVINIYCESIKPLHGYK